MNSSSIENLRIHLDRESVLRRIADRIRRSLELQDILTATAAEVRAYLATDRVKIYQFHPNGSGQVVAEAIDQARLPSLLGLNFPADDIPPAARDLFTRVRVRSVVDVSQSAVGQSLPPNFEQPAFEPDAGATLHYRALDPCHREYLTAMGVQSSIAVPIFHQEQLWGLLVSHHSEPRTVLDHEVQGLQMVVDQLSIAIAQSMLLAQAQAKANQEATIHQISTLLHSLSTIELQQALEATVAALHGSGGRLYLNPELLNLKTQTIPQHPEDAAAANCLLPLYLCGEQPKPIVHYLMEESSLWQNYFSARAAQLSVIPDIYQLLELHPLHSAFRATKIRSLLTMPLVYRQQLLGYLSVFRNEAETKTLWAGQFDSDQRQHYPRRSFELWCESKQAQVQEWTAIELQMAQALQKQFATAIQQYETHQKLLIINANLENQVQARTAELQQTADQQQALLGVITKIRESLDVDTIFRTTSREVCGALHVDRVAVYRFRADWGGEFVNDFEAANPAQADLIGLGMMTVWDDTYLQETQGGRYRENQTLAVDDIYQMGFASCHVQALESFRIKAFIIAPIFVGANLWGLLAIYEHQATRQWEPLEVQFVAQVAVQLGVALQQAELLNQTQQQTTQLAETLRDLRQTQSHLIQTEKMSSLGQLVAGVAHEINNPVNFIYGNLSHANSYAEDLLGLLHLYQQHYPQPHPEIQAQANAIDLSFLAEDFPKTLASMRLGADRIRQIVLSLRNFSRLDQAEIKSIDLHEGLDSTLLILQHRLKATVDRPEIEVIKNYGALPAVECYAGQLNQVFMNILSNAIDALEDRFAFESAKASPSCTLESLVISLQTKRQKDDRVAIQIRDNGMGIPDSARANLFEAFFTTKPIGKGTGLGLSISYEIVVGKHGGSLSCHSELGKGAEFLIEIPIQQPPAFPAHPKPGRS